MRRRCNRLIGGNPAVKLKTHLVRIHLRARTVLRLLSLGSVCSHELEPVHYFVRPDERADAILTRLFALEEE